MKNYEDITIQISDTKKSINLGRILQRNHPEIAELYIGSKGSLSKVVEKLDVQSKYDVFNDVALDGVCYAIVGHEEGFRIEGYVGLITDEEERERIKEKHKNENKVTKIRSTWHKTGFTW